MIFKLKVFLFTMYAKFTKQTKLLASILLIFSPFIFEYLLSKHTSTPVKYGTGRYLKDKYQGAEDDQNETEIFAESHGNVKRQTYLKKNANAKISERNPDPVYTELHSFSRNTRENMDLLDIMGLPQIKFDQTYKNPCFIGDSKNQLFNDGNLHCLPYFYLIGVKKSGTTDLFNRISFHPEFKSPGFKEAQWFPRIRFGYSVRSFYTQPIYKTHSFESDKTPSCLQRRVPVGDIIKGTLKKGIDNRSIKYYISLFDTAAYLIESCSAKNKRGDIYHNCITAEGTPGNLHMSTNWDLLHGNEGLMEPRYTNLHYIKHITPNAKIIIIFRDPVTRLFSDFKQALWAGNFKASTVISQEFHTNVTVWIQAYVSCFRKLPMRTCIYNDTLLEKENVLLKDSFRAGFYAFFWEELLSVFSRDQILPIHMTRYVSYTGETLANTFAFLNMSPLSSKELSEILAHEVFNRIPIKGQMFEETKNMLYAFYKPYNERMAEVMNDRAYLFLQS